MASWIRGDNLTSQTLDEQTDPNAFEPWQLAVLTEEARMPNRLIGLSAQWDRRFVQYDPRNGPCPACGDRKIPSDAMCLVCHATSWNPDQMPMSKRVPLTFNGREIPEPPPLPPDTSFEGLMELFCGFDEVAV